MKRSWWLQAALYAFLVAAAVIVLYAGRMRRAVDVQGGIRLVYQVEFDPGDSNEAREGKVKSALYRIRSRFDMLHDPERAVTREGNRIVIELPGVDLAEAARIKAIIGRL
jgi:preprotein translocase subunit SecD